MEDKKKKGLIALVAILGIVLITAGATYAWFSYSKSGIKENTITSGNIVFHYDEVGQGLSLEDAMPMTDIEGKAQDTYFDFRITSKVGGGMDVPYTVTVKMDENSTLPAEYVKLYLTDQSDNQIEPVRLFNSLSPYTHGTINTVGEKIIYEGLVKRNSSNYNKNFRLRMWIADNINMNQDGSGIGTYNGNAFKIKVNVYSEGTTSSDAEAQTKSNTAIESFTVNGENVTAIDNTHFESGIKIAPGQENVTVPIIVDTENENAQVTIEKVNNIGQVIKENKIRKISATNNYTLEVGTHYFKITVKPEDKSEPTVYYLTVTVEVQEPFTAYLKRLNTLDVVQDDLSEDANMRFVGNNPNNYVLFGCSDESNPTIETCEVWRIIGVFDENSHGRTGEELVKIVKVSSLERMSWSSNNGVDWTNASLNPIINPVDTTSAYYKYKNSSLVQSVIWKTGVTTWSTAASVGGAKKIYTGERSNTGASSTYNTTWEGIVALPYASDYLFATDGKGGRDTATTREICLETARPYTSSANPYWKVNSTDTSKSDCSKGSWLSEAVSNSGYNFWTLSSDTSKVFFINQSLDYGVLNESGSGYSWGVAPTVYLKSNVICKNCHITGAGSSSNPYILGS